MKYYCIGIKGTGMSTLAQILHDLGNEVSGYDDARAHKFTEDGLVERIKKANEEAIKYNEEQNKIKEAEISEALSQ
jgi:UDP-N-acetylmuramate-alanine ligase